MSWLIFHIESNEIAMNFERNMSYIRYIYSWFKKCGYIVLYNFPDSFANYVSVWCWCLCYQSLKQESVVVKSDMKEVIWTDLAVMMTKQFTYFENDLRIIMMHIFFQWEHEKLSYGETSNLKLIIGIN